MTSFIKSETLSDKQRWYEQQWKAITTTLTRSLTDPSFCISQNSVSSVICVYYKHFQESLEIFTHMSLSILPILFWRLHACLCLHEHIMRVWELWLEFWILHPFSFETFFYSTHKAVDGFISLLKESSTRELTKGVNTSMFFHIVEQAVPLCGIKWLRFPFFVCSHALNPFSRKICSVSRSRMIRFETSNCSKR